MLKMVLADFECNLNDQGLPEIRYPYDRGDHKNTATEFRPILQSPCRYLGYVPKVMVLFECMHGMNAMTRGSVDKDTGAKMTKTVFLL